MAGLAPALSLDDLFWAMLLGAGVSDAVDLALIARRAAEDSGCPFFVVHEGSHAHAIEPVSAPSRELCEAFVGRAAGRVRRAASPARCCGERGRSGVRGASPLCARQRDARARGPHRAPSRRHRTRARERRADGARRRGSAWRLVARRRRSPACGRARRVRRARHRLASISGPATGQGARAGPRRDRARARGPAACERRAARRPAQGGLRRRPDLGAGLPGVGRIPRIVSGVIAPEREVDSTDLDAIIHNVLADERGKRAFVLGGEEGHALGSIPQATAESAGDVDRLHPRPVRS